MDLRTSLKISGPNPAPWPVRRAEPAARAGRAPLALLGFLVAWGMGTSCRGRGAAEADAKPRPAATAVAPASAASGGAPAAAPFALVGGTPAGGLSDWIADVRRGLVPIPAQAARDGSDAQRAALVLYLTRQEYIEMYWGVAGKLTRGPVLGPAVKEAETRFHAVLADLQPGRPMRPGVLRMEIDSLGVQYDRVMAAAKGAGVPLDPHTLVRRAAGAEAAVQSGPGGGRR